MDKRYKYIGVRGDKGFHKKFQFAVAYPDYSMNGCLIACIMRYVREFEQVQGGITQVQLLQSRKEK